MEDLKIKFIPGTHSTQSVLEAQFSHARRMKLDTAANYHLHTATQTSRSVYNSKRVGSSSYDDVGEVEAASEDQPQRIGSQMKERMIAFEGWEKKEAKSVSVKTIAVQESTEVSSILCTTVAGYLKKMEVPGGSFAQFLRDSIVVQDYAVLSIGLDFEDGMRLLFSGENDQELNEFCQNVANLSFEALDRASSAAKTTVSASYWWQFHKNIVPAVRTGHISPKFGFWQRFFIAQKIAEGLLDWAGDALADITNVCKAAVEETTGNQPDDSKQRARAIGRVDLNKFGGWAIVSLVKKHSLSSIHI
jgi:hypothetical protein